MYRYIFFIGLAISFLSCQSSNGNHAASSQESTQDSISITPIYHASFVLGMNKQTIYVDPIKSPDLYKDLSSPDLILITHDHGDHLSIKTLKALLSPNTLILAPESVNKKLPERLKEQTTVMNNGDIKNVKDLKIKAMPMYNLRPEAKKFHPKGKGNGYLITFKDKRIYISGDTEDIPAMRHLKHIDIAFVCMNLPYTMSVNQAIQAVLAFHPKTVYPYHYKGTDGYSDVQKFKETVEQKNPNIQVKLLNWYPNRSK